MKYIISDIETNGLLDTVSKFHCAWTYDMETKMWRGWEPSEGKAYKEYLDDGTEGDIDAGSECAGGACPIK